MRLFYEINEEIIKSLTIFYLKNTFLSISFSELLQDLDVKSLEKIYFLAKEEGNELNEKTPCFSVKG